MALVWFVFLTRLLKTKNRGKLAEVISIFHVNIALVELSLRITLREMGIVICKQNSYNLYFEILGDTF
jgi:hypothetical protein